MSEYRPRLPNSVEEVIEKHATQHNKTKIEMLEEMVRAYDEGITNSTALIETNNTLLSDIHDALKLNAQPTTGNGDTPEIESENGTQNNINYNALSIGHGMEFEKEDENWAMLWENNIIKHRPKYLLPVIEGFLNHYSDGDFDEYVFDSIILPEFGLSEHSEYKYKFEYGPEYDVWHPKVKTDPKFSPESVYARGIEELARYAAAKGGEKKTQSKQEQYYRNKFDDFDDMFPFKFKDPDGTTHGLWDDQSGFYRNQIVATVGLKNLLEDLRDLATGKNSNARRIAILHGALVDYGFERDLLSYDEMVDLGEEMDKVAPSN